MDHLQCELNDVQEQITDLSETSASPQELQHHQQMIRKMDGNLEKQKMELSKRAERKLEKLRNLTSNLYLNIPQDEGTTVCLDALQDHDLLPMPRELLQTLFDIVLKCNVFSFSTHNFTFESIISTFRHHLLRRRYSSPL